MSKALEIADRLKETYTIAHLPREAERELRRLHEINADFVVALIDAKANAGSPEKVYEITSAALSKAKEQA